MYRHFTASLVAAELLLFGRTDRRTAIIAFRNVASALITELEVAWMKEVVPRK